MSVISKTVGFQFTSENPDKCAISRKIIFHFCSQSNELRSLRDIYSNRKCLKYKWHLENVTASVWILTDKSPSFTF